MNKNVPNEMIAFDEIIDAAASLLTEYQERHNEDTVMIEDSYYDGAAVFNADHPVCMLPLLSDAGCIVGSCFVISGTYLANYTQYALHFNSVMRPLAKPILQQVLKLNPSIAAQISRIPANIFIMQEGQMTINPKLAQAGVTWDKLNQAYVSLLRPSDSDFVVKAMQAEEFDTAEWMTINDHQYIVGVCSFSY